MATVFGRFYVLAVQGMVFRPYFVQSTSELNSTSVLDSGMRKSAMCDTLAMPFKIVLSHLPGKKHMYGILKCNTELRVPYHNIQDLRRKEFSYYFKYPHIDFNKFDKYRIVQKLIRSVGY